MASTNNNTISFATAKAAATGRWPEILQYLGIPGEALTGKHQPCPGCGGRDRFRYLNDEHGGWICGQGGIPTGGDGFNLLVHCQWSKAGALHTVSQYLGIDDRSLTAEQHEEIRKRKQQAQFNGLDDGIYHECHILMQTTAGRKNNRDFEHDHKFREARPDWTPYPKEVWEREILAANRLKKMMENRYGI